MKYHNLIYSGNYNLNMSKIKRFEAFLESNSEQNIIKLLEESAYGGWYGGNMKNSFDCVRCENDWEAKLTSQYKGDSTIDAILLKIEKCGTCLWEDNLDETFDCVVIEDVFDEDDNLVIEYNGWYEELITYLNTK